MLDSCKSLSENGKELEPLLTASGNIKWCSSLENSVAFLQNVRHRVSLGLRNSILRYLPKINKNIYTHTRMFKTSLFITATK